MEKTQEALSLSEERSKLLGEIEGLKKEMALKEENSAKIIDSLNENATQSFLVGFQTALKQATIVQPTINLSELDPGKTVVDDKLVEINFKFYGL